MSEEAAKAAYPDNGSDNWMVQPFYQEGYEKAEEDLVPLIHKLAESVLFDWDNRAEVAKDVLIKLQGHIRR